MRILWMIAFVTCAALWPAMRIEAAPASASAPATIISCPAVLLIESSNGTYYISVFESKMPSHVPLDMTLYSKSAVYRVAIPTVDITTPFPAEKAYRSEPQIVKNPGDDELLGAAINPAAGSPYAGCSGENIVIPSVASLTSPDRHLDPASDALETELVSEAASSKTILVPTPASGISVPECTDAFADASVDNLVKPVFPSDIRNDPTLQAIAVRVALDATGKVLGATIESSSGSATADAIALEAAKASTYHPERIACLSERSSHVTRIDFSH